MTSAPLHVAVVDDDPSVCRSLGRLLRAAGMESVTYASAEAFLADTRQPRFDCIVLDVQLGGMSGIELGMWLAAEGSIAPLIYVTAYDDPETQVRAKLAGCAAYFRKSDAGDMVLAKIRQLVEERCM